MSRRTQSSRSEQSTPSEAERSQSPASEISQEPDSDFGEYPANEKMPLELPVEAPPCPEPALDAEEDGDFFWRSIVKDKK